MHTEGGFVSYSVRLDLMINMALISSLSRIIVNFSIYNITSVYLASNLVIDLIYLHTALDITICSSYSAQTSIF